MIDTFKSFGVSWMDYNEENGYDEDYLCKQNEILQNAFYEAVQGKTLIIKTTNFNDNHSFSEYSLLLPATDPMWEDNIFELLTNPYDFKNGVDIGKTQDKLALKIYGATKDVLIELDELAPMYISMNQTYLGDIEERMKELFNFETTESPLDTMKRDIRVEKLDEFVKDELEEIDEMSV